MIKNLNEIIDYCLSFIKDDFTELWVIANKVMEENPEIQFSELVINTKFVVKELIVKYNVLLLDEETERSINLDVDSILEIVEIKFRTLGKIPNIGDGIWFTIGR